MAAAALEEVSEVAVLAEVLEASAEAEASVAVVPAEDFSTAYAPPLRDCVAYVGLLKGRVFDTLEE